MTTSINDNQLLTTYGWNDGWEATMNGERYAGLLPARVTAQYSHCYRIVMAEGERIAEVTGKFEFEAILRSQYPAVGDWVAVQPLQGEPKAVIHAVLPRSSAMIRRAAGSVPVEQVVGANMDYLFIVNALNDDFNLRKLERYLVAAWESGAAPVVLLTKADLCEDASSRVAAVESIAPGVAVHAVSAMNDQGKEALEPYLQRGRTIAVIGSSGVGKSTLLNWLSGDDLQRVQGIREDDARGRHTTTHRELFPLPNGAVMIDTPGMRELQLWDSEEGWQEAFADIEALAAACRFRDCRHEQESGCAVKEAIAEGTLDAKRFASYKKTGKELAHMARKEQSVSQRLKKSSNKRTASKNDRHRLE